MNNQTRSFIVVARLNFEGVFPYTGASGASAESWRPEIAASIEKYRLTCADREHEENNSSGPVTFPLAYGTPAAVGSPLPRLRGPYHPPFVEQSPSP